MVMEQAGRPLRCPELAAFTRRLDALVATHSDDAPTLVAALRQALEYLLTDMQWLPPAYCQPQPDGRDKQYVLHRHPARAYVVISRVVGAGWTTLVHDHKSWGVVGVWQGEEHEERFVRTDAHARPGYATLRSLGGTVHGPGSTSLLLPPDDIHRIGNPGPTPALSLHVYGRVPDGEGCDVFNLETGTVTRWRRGR
jgi:predicted metal-dependent enzyme (double-stranded beta helix superfamily)